MKPEGTQEQTNTKDKESWKRNKRVTDIEILIKTLPLLAFYCYLSNTPQNNCFWGSDRKDLNEIDDFCTMMSKASDRRLEG